jgi:hypothetical protein
LDYFYDGQIRRYLAQFIQVMSNFSYKDSKGQLVQVPVRYGDMTRQVAQILKKNSENTIPSAPFIACYIKDLQFDRPRLQDPTFVSKIHIREREFDDNAQEYLNTQGSNYTIERLMPTPYTITFAADVWTSSTDQKLQLWEQIAVLFTPSFEIQTTDNYVDWTSLSVIDIDSQIFTSRQIPQGTSEDIDIFSWTFKAPIWITPPAKVKKLGIITKIITNIFSSNAKGSINSIYDKIGAAEMFEGTEPDATITVTPGDFDLLVLNNTARLINSNGDGEAIDLSNPRNSSSWHTLLDVYPGKFRAGLSQLRFNQDGESEVVAYISLDPVDDRIMTLNVDTDTIPTNTILSGRGTVDAIINPETYDPRGLATGTRYLILEDINLNEQFGTLGYDGPDAWKNTDNSDFQAHANDIIEWDGTNWVIIFNSTLSNNVIYITNSYTGTQYKWSNGSWSKVYEGIYDKRLWRLVL